MQFINEQNGYVEEKSSPWLWTLLFGGLYFLVSGIWIHFFLMFILSGIFAGVLGGSGVGPLGTLALTSVVNVGYAFVAGSIVRGHFLRKGWKEATDDDVTLVIKQKIKERDQLASGKPLEKTCPFCAETIKFEAKICKHCGREQPEHAGA